MGEAKNPHGGPSLDAPTLTRLAFRKEDVVFRKSERRWRMDPERMRAAVADYVTALHRAYLAQADTFPPAVRGRDAAAQPAVHCRSRRWGRATCTCSRRREGLGPLRGQEVAVEGSLPGLDWTLRFYDPVVAPALGLIVGGRRARVRRGAGRAGRHDRRLPRRRPAGVGAHAAPRGARRRGARGGAHGGGARLRDDPHAGARAGRRWSTSWSGAAHAGLPRAQALLARAIAPRDEAVAALADACGEPGPGRGAQGAAGLGGRPQQLDPDRSESPFS